ncbi:MAG: hypothetical protein WCN27_06340 [Alphaproteobacteria bacterium]
MTKGNRFVVFFSNLFNVPSITDSRLQLFCRFVIATLTTANIGGILDPVLLPLNAAYLAYFGDSKDKTINKAIKKSSTSGLNSVVKKFAEAVRGKHHLIASIYPEDSMEYIEFFPEGLTAFSHLTRGNILEIANQFSVTATKYKDTLGGIPFATIFSDCNAAIIAALGVQTDKKGAAKKINSQIITMRAPVEDALMAVMFKIGSMFGPNWEKCLSFFDFSLLTASHHAKGFTSNGELIGLQESNCLEVPITNTSIFLLKNPNIVPIYYSLSAEKEGVMVGVEIELKPNTNLIVAFSEFQAAAGLFLNVKNKTVYIVKWEVHLD